MAAGVSWVQALGLHGTALMAYAPPPRASAGPLVYLIMSGDLV